MTEQELNINLAEAMGYIREEATIKCENNSVKYSVLWDENGNQVVDFSYKDPAIFTELVIALLDNKYSISKEEYSHPDMTDVYVATDDRQDIDNQSPYKAVALAFIAMKEAEA